MAAGHEDDPYAPPRSPVEAEDSIRAMRSGNLLMVRSETPLPLICPFTGVTIEDSSLVEWRPVTWRSPWSYLPIAGLAIAIALTGNNHGWIGRLLIIVTFALVSYFTARKFHADGRIAYAIYPPLKRSMRRRRLASLGFVILALATAWTISLAPSFDGTVTTLVALLFVILSLFPLTTIPRLRAVSYQSGWFYLKGCSTTLLDSLPEATTPPV